MKNGKITIKDVAEYANVSPATVSRVLNDYKWINLEVKERVKKAIDDLHYVPDFTAKAMVKGQSQMAVVIVPVIDNHFFTQLINTIIQEMKKYGYYVVVYTTESAEEEADFLGSSICQMADGILNATSLKDMGQLKRVQKPMVLIDRYFEENQWIDCVVNKNYEALYQATEYLIRQGHTRIGLVIGKEGHGIAKERIRGFKDCLRAYYIPWREEYLIQDSWKTAAGVRGAARLLELEQPPTAIFGGNNTLTAGIDQELRRRGLLPGRDISVIGFEECDDDSELFEESGISCFRLDTSLMAVQAVRLLIRRIRHPNEPWGAERAALELKFIERTSVGREKAVF